MFGQWMGAYVQSRREYNPSKGLKIIVSKRWGRKLLVVFYISTVF